MGTEDEDQRPSDIRRREQLDGPKATGSLSVMKKEEEEEEGKKDASYMCSSSAGRLVSPCRQMESERKVRSE